MALNRAQLDDALSDVGLDLTNEQLDQLAASEEAEVPAGDLEGYVKLFCVKAPKINRRLCIYVKVSGKIRVEKQ